ncbi:Transcriptional regulator, LysR family [Labilithrix luteola]|uniref:Transcriptional regulator, LysR family n=1 Tax=Labilithrix luteola TaxID=1391654 RepID=A0A0K1Q0P1_9BACT|nr:LysR family transcriptional regulator [Labilithrix luteola]AKU99297.1 Transcriptional regulator, LysR family [Labilithrix luteola]
MDGFSEIGVFVRVVEARGFTRAGQSLGLTASGVSRVLSRLEARLGVRLLDRTTRSLGLTAEGAAYYERCTHILRELEDANLALASVRATPRGRVRVDAPTILGRFLFAPALPQFLERYADLAMDLTVRDHVIDPIAEGIDIVVRMAALQESELVHKKIGAVRMPTVASPDYLRRRGRPTHPSDLRRHETIGFLAGGLPIPYRFRGGNEPINVPPSSRLHSNSVDAIRHAAVAGLGITQLMDVHVRNDIAAGRLEVVLDDHEAPPRLVHALFAREKAAMPKVRVCLEFLTDCLRSGEREPAKGKRGRRRSRPT